MYGMLKSKESSLDTEKEVENNSKSGESFYLVFGKF